MIRKLGYDEIGYWSEIKLDVIKEYVAAYSRILTSWTSPKFYHLYIDAFAGAGQHRSKTTGEFVLGSPVNALLVSPPFREYHFIDLDEQKIESLEKLAGTRKDVLIHHGDCNQVLLKEVAGFQNVPRPIAMRNTQNAVIYYLFFASHKPVAENIVQYIFSKYANRRGS